MFTSSPRWMVAILLVLAPLSVVSADGKDAAQLHGRWTMVAMADANGKPVPGVEVKKGDYIIEFRADGTYVVKAFDGKGDSSGRYSLNQGRLILFEDGEEDENGLPLPYTYKEDVLSIIFDYEGEDIVTTFHRVTNDS